jgi:hypothetical protein
MIFSIDFSWFTVQVGALSKPPLSRSLVALVLSGEIDGFLWLLEQRVKAAGDCSHRHPRPNWITD